MVLSFIFAVPSPILEKVMIISCVWNKLFVYPGIAHSRDQAELPWVKGINSECHPCWNSAF